MVCGLKLYGIYAEYKQSDSIYVDLAEGYVKPREERQTLFSAGNQAEKVEQPPVTIDFDSLCAENPNTVGWLYCENTVINYPIMRSDDNEYYVHRLYDGTRGKAGALFMDFRCTADFSDYNTIIYGHNMKDDSMFGTLEEYKSQDYYDIHPEMWLLTREGSYRLELIAGYITDVDSDTYVNLQSRVELNEYIARGIDISTFASSYEAGTAEKIAVLSTCTYEYENARYVLLCNMIRME